MSEQPAGSGGFTGISAGYSVGHTCLQCPPGELRSHLARMAITWPKAYGPPPPPLPTALSHPHITTAPARTWPLTATTWPKGEQKSRSSSGVMSKAKLRR